MLKRPKLKTPKGLSRKPYPSPPKRGAMMKGIKGYVKRLRNGYDKGKP